MPEDVRALPNQRPRGVTAELTKLFSSFTRHLVALGSLASEEGREALSRYLRVLALLVGAIFMLVFGYGTFIAFLAILAIRVLHVDALWVTLALVIIQVASAVVCGLVIRNYLKAPLFPITTEEIRKDLESLKADKP